MITERIQCPHCNYSKDISLANLPKEATDAVCPSCQKSFKYIPPNTNINKKDINLSYKINNHFSYFTKLNILMGTIIFASYFNPLAQIFGIVSNGMYGPYFRNFSPAIYHLATLLLVYTTTTLIIILIFNKLNVFKRLNKDYSSPTLFGIGNVVIILYLVIRVFASTIPGGGPPFVVSIIGIIPITIAKICLGIAIIRLLIGMEPIRASSEKRSAKTEPTF